MIVPNVRACVGLCLFLTICPSAFSQQQDARKSCQAVVGGFYSWYLDIALKHNRLTKPNLALKSRPGLFSPELAQRLREDSEAQEKAGSDLVSLDADPFIGADGPAERYVVESVTVKDAKCWAEVHGVREGKEGEMPDVTPELELKDGRWLFVNFYFPSPSDPKAWNLLGALASDRELQKKYRPENEKKP